MNLLKLEYTPSHFCGLSKDEPVDMFDNSNWTKNWFNTKIVLYKYNMTTSKKSKLEQKKKIEWKELENVKYKVNELAKI